MSPELPEQRLTRIEVAPPEFKGYQLPDAMATRADRAAELAVFNTVSPVELAVTLAFATELI